MTITILDEDTNAYAARHKLKHKIQLCAFLLAGVVMGLLVSLYFEYRIAMRPDVLVRDCKCEERGDIICRCKDHGAH
jgi:hypothetical protein